MYLYIKNIKKINTQFLLINFITLFTCLIEIISVIEILNSISGFIENPCNRSFYCSVSVNADRDL